MIVQYRDGVEFQRTHNTAHRFGIQKGPNTRSIWSFIPPETKNALLRDKRNNDPLVFFVFEQARHARRHLKKIEIAGHEFSPAVHRLFLGWSCCARLRAVRK